VLPTAQPMIVHAPNSHLRSPPLRLASLPLPNPGSGSPDIKSAEWQESPEMHAVTTEVGTAVLLKLNEFLLAEKTRLQEIFRRFDGNKTNELDRGAMEDLLQACGVLLSPAALTLTMEFLGNLFFSVSLSLSLSSSSLFARLN